MKIISIIWIILLLISCNSGSDNEKNIQQSPNIIFILTDDLGWGDLGSFYQNQRAEEDSPSNPWQLTPHLDEMARQGIMLTDHYANAPVCAPSRASFLTGMHQGHANVRDNQFDKALENNYTVGNVLQEKGYRTVAIGKWGLQGDPLWEEDGDTWPGHPLHRGFDEFYGYIRHRDGHEHYPVEGIYRGPKEVYHNHENVAEGLAKCFTGDLWTAFAKKWILEHRKLNNNTPFFMFLAYDTPHAVIELPTQEYPEGGGLEGGLQWLGEPGRMINTASGEVDSWTHPDYKNATWDHDQDPGTAEIPWPDTYKRFATVNRRIDDAIGDLRKLLADLDLDDNTLVVFTSDNGPSMESYLPEEYVNFTPEFFRSYGPFDGIKRDLWEGGVRVPAIATWPARIPQGEKSTQPSMISDWLATFADAAGLEVPERLDGESLIPILEGKSFEDRHPVYIEYFQQGRTPEFQHFLSDHAGRKRGQMQLIRIDNMVGVRYDIQDHMDDFEIYDVIADPQQSNNLALQNGYEDFQNKLKNQVLRMRMPDTSAVRPYDLELIPALPLSYDKLSEGLEVAWYRTESKWIPKTDILEPIGKGVVDGLIIPFDASGNLIMYSGYFMASEDGWYSFMLNTRNQTLFRIHDALVLDGDFHTDRQNSMTGKVNLQKGIHPIRLFVKDSSNDGWNIELKVKPPSGDDFDAMNADHLFHQ